MLIGFDAIRELRRLRISQDFGPASQVKPGLRLKIRKLDGDRTLKGNRTHEDCARRDDSPSADL
jgi:hypothetical protein